jgi:hypothetical protein
MTIIGPWHLSPGRLSSWNLIFLIFFRTLRGKPFSLLELGIRDVFDPGCEQAVRIAIPTRVWTFSFDHCDVTGYNCNTQRSMKVQFWLDVAGVYSILPCPRPPKLEWTD